MERMRGFIEKKIENLKGVVGSMEKSLKRRMMEKKKR